VSPIPSDVNFGVVKLEKDSTGLFETEFVYKNIIKIITQIKEAGKHLLLITDFDSTLTKVHLYWSLYGKDNLPQYKEFSEKISSLNEHKNTYNKYLNSDNVKDREKIKQFYFHKDPDGEYRVNKFFADIKGIYSPTIQVGGYIYDKKLNPITKLDIDIVTNCKEVNTYFMKILNNLLTSIEFKEPIPNPNLVFMMVMMEYYYCNSQNYIDQFQFDCRGISDNDTFSSKIISPMVSDLYSLRYDSLTTQCFHANNYFNKTTYKLKKYYNIEEKKDTFGNNIYLFGGVVDIYGNYKSKNKAMLVCLDNSSFFNSVFEDSYKSRAYLSFDSNHKIFKSILKGGGYNDEDDEDDEEEGEDEGKDEGDENNEGGESQPDKAGLYPEQYLQAFELHNCISIYTEPNGLPKAITNSTKLPHTIKIGIDLYKVLLDFKQIKQYAHANYYGSTEFNMILSTIGLESRAKARHGKSREDNKKIMDEKTNTLKLSEQKRLDKIIDLSDLKLTSVQKSVKTAVLSKKKSDPNISVSTYITSLKIKKNLHKTNPKNPALTAEEKLHLTVEPIAA